MPIQTTQYRPLRSPNIGDLKNYITLQNRDITAPVSGADFSETFSTNVQLWAGIKTVRGRTAFDSLDVERNITHEITIRYVDGITAETWILFNGYRYDIINSQNYEERDEWLLLQCEKRGPSTVGGASA